MQNGYDFQDRRDTDNDKSQIFKDWLGKINFQFLLGQLPCFPVTDNHHVNLRNAIGLETWGKLTSPTRAIKVNVKSYTALIWAQAGTWTEIIVLASRETELHLKNPVCLSPHVNTLHN